MKKSSYFCKIFSLFLSLCLLLPFVCSLPSWAETVSFDKSKTGLSFEGFSYPYVKANGTSAVYDMGNESYQASKSFKEAPHTFSAWVYIPSSVGNARVGVVLGNYAELGSHQEGHVNFEIHKSRSPRLQYYDETGLVQISLIFSKSKVPANKWTHVALAVDKVSSSVSCYINGSLTETKYTCPDFDNSATEMPYALGGDFRAANAQYFKGSIGSASAYASARTAEQIAEEYKNGVNTAESDLLCHYDVSSSDKGKTIKDLSGNGLDLTYSKSWLSEEEMAEIRKSYDLGKDWYSFAMIGDTQYTVESFPHNFSPIYQWLADNAQARRIKYVCGLGDITDNDTAEEWARAKAGIELLDGKVEYMLVRGNHDVRNGGAQFDALFASDPDYATQFKGDVGGSMSDTSLANTYRIITVNEGTQNEIRYLFISLDYGASNDAVEWASSVINDEKHSDCRVIILTHAYLVSDGTTITGDDVGVPSKANTSLNDGKSLWTKLVSKHKNIELIACGHITQDNIVCSQVKGDNENTVTQLLIDPQNTDSALGGLGLVAILNFSGDGNKVQVEYYSTVYGKYYKTSNQFAIDLRATAEAPEEEVWDGNAEKPLGSGTKADPYLISSAGNLLWMSESIKADPTLTFKGQYFVQSCDIDLNGRNIRSIGYYFLDENTKMYAFSGNYNGNGYAIFNGAIVSAHGEHQFNQRWGHGLFGTIFGATIENIVLRDVQVIGHGVTGAIVGRAAAPLATPNAESGFNTIRNCHVESSVQIVTIPTLHEDGTSIINAYDNHYRAGIVGGICGMAHASEIELCSVDSEIYVTGDFGMVGGISGSAGYNTVIDRCAFTGGLNLRDNTSTQACSMGGIVGFLSPNTLTASDSAPASGFLHIKNCYNDAYYLYRGDAATASDVYWGGILGNAGPSDNIAKSESVPYPYYIENCHNLYAKEKTSLEAKYFVGGIVAKSTAGSGYGVLYVKDSSSVLLDAAGESGNNELRYDTGKLSSDGLCGAVAIPDGNGNSTVKTLTAEEIRTKTKLIQAEIDDYRKSLSQGEVTPPDQSETTTVPDVTTSTPAPDDDVTTKAPDDVTTTFPSDVTTVPSDESTTASEVTSDTVTPEDEGTAEVTDEKKPDDNTVTQNGGSTQSSSNACSSFTGYGAIVAVAVVTILSLSFLPNKKH